MPMPDSPPIELTEPAGVILPNAIGRMPMPDPWLTETETAQVIRPNAIGRVPMPDPWLMEQTEPPKVIRSKGIRIAWYLVHILIILPVAISMILYPFFSPFAILVFRQKVMVFFCHHFISHVTHHHDHSTGRMDSSL
jgi:hypothetical protein